MILKEKDPLEELLEQEQKIRMLECRINNLILSYNNLSKKYNEWVNFARWLAGDDFEQAWSEYMNNEFEER